MDAVETSVSFPQEEQHQPQSGLLSALRAQVTVRNDLNVIAKKLRTVARERKVLLRTIEAAKKTTETALDDFAKTECRILCDEVAARLPREVRDMIYDCILSEEHCETTITSEYFEGSERTSNTLNHWRYAAFVGDKLHQELGEHFFRHTVFTFGPDAEGLQQLPKFRTMDASKIGYIPAQFVCNIQVDIDCSTYNVDKFPFGLKKEESIDNGWVVANAWGSVDDDYGTKYESKVGLWTSLELMFGFQPGTKILIHLNASRRSGGGHLADQEWLSDNIVPLISPTIQRCKAIGYHMSLSLAIDYKNWIWNTYNPGMFPDSDAIWKDAFQQHKIREIQRMEEVKNAMSADEEDGYDSDDLASGSEDGPEEEG